MSNRLNILTLYQIREPKKSRSSLLNHITFLERSYPEHNYLYHNALIDLPESIKDLEFDAIILDVTFLALRWGGGEKFLRMKQEYAFIADKNSYKIAFPQDDYDCCAVLDNWMYEYNVNIVYSVCEQSFWPVLYPKLSEYGVLRLAYTAYLDDSTSYPVSFIKPFNQRTIDVGYRAHKLPYYFGYLGQEKWKIGTIFSKYAKKYSLKCDISVNNNKVILGKDWVDFINNSKFTLGANSGSSMIDPFGNIQRQVKLYCLDNPMASFEEVESLFFPGIDGQYVMTALSPRVLEAGMLKSSQILVKGEYSGILHPWEHYIPIDSDGGNFEEVYDAMMDVKFVTNIARHCYETLRDSEKLYYKHHANMILDDIANHINCQHISRISNREFDKMMKDYDQKIRPKIKYYIMKLRLSSFVSNKVSSIGYIDKMLKRHALKHKNYI